MQNWIITKPLTALNLEPSISLLSQLPDPPPGKTGWPWTEESQSLSPHQPDDSPWPRISIITPSLNQGQYIEETIRSVLLQNYPNLEYILIDGGSTDNTQEVIEKYKKKITYCFSEPDNGQSHAINKGFLKCTGDYVNWICSDDTLCKNALNNISSLLITKEKVLLLGGGFRIDKNSKVIDSINSSEIDNVDKLVDIRKYWRNRDSILQQSCLFHVASARETGLLNENNHFTMDYELWGKLMINGISVVKTNLPIGMYRWYAGQKTSRQRQVTESLIRTAQKLILSNPETGILRKVNQLIKIRQYSIFYNYSQFRSLIGFKRRFKILFHG